MPATNSYVEIQHGLQADGDRVVESGDAAYRGKNARDECGAVGGGVPDGDRFAGTPKNDDLVGDDTRQPNRVDRHPGDIGPPGSGVEFG